MYIYRYYRGYLLWELKLYIVEIGKIYDWLFVGRRDREVNVVI